MLQVGKRTAESIFLMMLLVLSASFFVNLNDGSLDFSDREIRIVVTDSMDSEPQPFDIPSIPRNSLVMFTHSGVMGVKVGDVVGYRTTAAGQPVFHRVVDIDRAMSQYILKGDNLPYSDRVSQEDIIGKVTGVDPLAGPIILSLKTNLPLLLVLVFLALVLSHLVSVLRENGSKRSMK